LGLGDVSKAQGRVHGLLYSNSNSNSSRRRRRRRRRMRYGGKQTKGLKSCGLYNEF